MTSKRKTALLIFITIILSLNFILPVYGAGNDTDTLYNNQGGILCISYRGDTANYPENSVEGVISAFEKGADMVSVSVRKNADGVLVLCEDGENPEQKGTALKELLSEIKSENILVVDFPKEIKDDVYDFLKNKNRLGNTLLRIQDSAKDIASWIDSKEEKPIVIGVSKSFNIFSVISHIKTLSKAGMPAVQYQSKNYFNVMYGSWAYENYSAEGMARAVAPMYDPELCGQRSDSEDGWNDLIKKNFSIIETNNLEAFVRYKENIEKAKQELSELLNTAEQIEPQKYSLVSRNNLAASITAASSALSGNVSADELQKCHSVLLLSMNNLALKEGEDTQKGALNITPGKIIAAVTVGAVIFAAQIFVHKMQKEKKRK